MVASATTGNSATTLLEDAAVPRLTMTCEWGHEWRK
jgi:hypothetical protein